MRHPIGCCFLALTTVLIATGVRPDLARAGNQLPPVFLSPRRDTLEHHVEDLVECLRSDSVFERQEAEVRLQHLGSRARSAVPALIELLQGEHLDKKHRACRVLEWIGPDAKAALPWLTKVLEGPQYPKDAPADVSNLHSSAVSAMGAIGPEAKEALPILTKIMDNKKSPLRMGATHAVFRITKDRARVAPVYLEVLKPPGVSGGYGRYAAAHFFRQHAAEYRDVQPILLEIVRNSKNADQVSQDLVSEAAYALWLMSKHEEAIPALLKLLEKKIAVYDAGMFLAEIGPPAKAAVPLLIDEIKQMSKEPPKHIGPDLFAQLSELRATVQCLGRFGLVARDAVEPLRPLLKHFNLGVQVDAAEALWKIDKSQQALEPLQRTTREGEPRLRMHAIGVLHDFNQMPKEATAAVVRFLQDEDFEVRYAAAELLKKIDPGTTHHQ